jgi:hypothetical protein
MDCPRGTFRALDMHPLPDIEFAGIPQHVVQRDNDRQHCFLTIADYRTLRSCPPRSLLAHFTQAHHPDTSSSGLPSRASATRLADVRVNSCKPAPICVTLFACAYYLL